MNCLEQSLRLLSSSAKSSKALRQKLLQRGFSVQETDQTIEKLEQLDLLSDRRLAAELVDYHFRHDPIGSIRLKQALLLKGIAEPLATQASLLTDQEEEDLARRLLAKKGQKKRSRAQLGRYLQSRGFSQRTIWQFLPLDDRDGDC